MGEFNTYDEYEARDRTAKSSPKLIVMLFTCMMTEMGDDFRLHIFELSPDLAEVLLTAVITVMVMILMEMVMMLKMIMMMMMIMMMIQMMIQMMTTYNAVTT
jgi:hypothetical protein